MGGGIILATTDELLFCLFSISAGSNLRLLLLRMPEETDLLSSDLLTAYWRGKVLTVLWMVSDVQCQKVDVEWL